MGKTFKDRTKYNDGYEFEKDIKTKKRQARDLKKRKQSKQDLYEKMIDEGLLGA